MVQNKHGDFSMAIDWTEAQAFRKSLKSGDGTPLPDEELHVTLSGGIADAIDNAKAPPSGDE